MMGMEDDAWDGLEDSIRQAIGARGRMTLDDLGRMFPAKDAAIALDNLCGCGEVRIDGDTVWGCRE